MKLALPQPIRMDSAWLRWLGACGVANPPRRGACLSDPTPWHLRSRALSSWMHPRHQSKVTLCRCWVGHNPGFLDCRPIDPFPTFGWWCWSGRHANRSACKPWTSLCFSFQMKKKSETRRPTSHQPNNQYVSHSVNHSLCKSVSQSIDRSLLFHRLTYRLTDPLTYLLSHSINESLAHSLTQ